MIAFGAYLLVFIFLIYKNGFFGLFNLEGIGKKHFALIFLGKALAVPALYFLFLKLYGGIDRFDAGKFYFDAKLLNGLGRDNFPEYLKMLFGLQDETPGSHFYNTIILPTFNWENGQSRDFFYNDNRIVIRIHSLLHFISFNSYFVHALFSCFLSYVGLTFLYKSVKEYFKGKELGLFLILCFFPTLWLYTGGLLKEGLSIFFLGGIVFTLKKVFEKGLTIRLLLIMVFLLFISLLLKPYLLFYSAVCFAVFFLVKKQVGVKWRSAAFFSSMAVVVVVVNFSSVILKNRSLPQAALDRQREFADLAKGGIFLKDSVKFVRLKYDYQQVNKVAGQKLVFTIKKDVPFTYWEDSHQQDTLYNPANKDTTTRYTLIYELPTAGSNIDLQPGDNFVLTAFKSLFYTMAQPFFFNAKGLMQLFASVENLILVLSFFLGITGLFLSKKDRLPPLVFLFFGISLFVLIGFTTPNSGAILRYRSPAAIFIVISALYYLDAFKKKV